MNWVDTILEAWATTPNPAPHPMLDAYKVKGTDLDRYRAQSEADATRRLRVTPGDYREDPFWNLVGVPMDGNPHSMLGPDLAYNAVNPSAAPSTPAIAAAPRNVTPAMSILDSIGAVASNSPATTAVGSTPDALKSLFAPLMETMVRDAQMRNDPISRMGDVGLAMLDASGGGKPFAQSLAPLDAARQQATGGAMNMFLQVMGLDRQLEEMKAQERRFESNYALDRAKFDLMKTQAEKESWSVEKVGETKEGQPIYGRVSKSGKVEPLVTGADPAKDDQPYRTFKGKPVLTPAQQAVDKKFGEEYSNLVAAGGLADAQKNLAQIKTIADRLKSGERLTGPEIGNLPRSIMRNTNPTATQALEMVEEVVQRNLRLILGAQFTQKEGERLIQRSYNAALDPKFNAERLARLVSAMEKAVEAKKAAIAYYEKNGTLAGYKGPPIPTVTDLEGEIGATQPKAPQKSKSGLTYETE